MIKALLEVLSKRDPDQAVQSDLEAMLRLADELVRQAGDCLWREPLTGAARDQFYEKDRSINRLQQGIRAALVGRLQISTAMERARFLVLMGLIKDVERVGDYAKNLLEAAELLQRPLPELDELARLRQLRSSVEATLGQTYDVLARSDAARARALLSEGQVVSERCEELVRHLARSSLPADLAVPLALAARHYKRIQKHLMNLLSSVVMPLHKVDYSE